MNDINNLRSGLEAKLLRVERDRADALAGIVEQCLDHLATMGDPDRAAETATIEARACLASALRRDDGRPLAVLVTEVRDIFDACRAALDMEPTEWATEIVAQIECFKAQRKKESGEYWEMTKTIRADADRWKAEHAAEVEALRAEIEALRLGPWRTPEEEAPPRGEWIGVVSRNGNYAYASMLSIDQPIDWMSHWRRLPSHMLKGPVTT